MSGCGDNGTAEASAAMLHVEERRLDDDTVAWRQRLTDALDRSGLHRRRCCVWSCLLLSAAIVSGFATYVRKVRNAERIRAENREIVTRFSHGFRGFGGSLGSDDERSRTATWTDTTTDLSWSKESSRYHDNDENPTRSTSKADRRVDSMNGVQEAESRRRERRDGGSTELRERRQQQRRRRRRREDRGHDSALDSDGDDEVNDVSDTKNRSTPNEPNTSNAAANVTTPDFYISDESLFAPAVARATTDVDYDTAAETRDLFARSRRHVQPHRPRDRARSPNAIARSEGVPEERGAGADDAADVCLQRSNERSSYVLGRSLDLCLAWTLLASQVLLSVILYGILATVTNARWRSRDRNSDDRVVSVDKQKSNTVLTVAVSNTVAMILNIGLSLVLAANNDDVATTCYR